MKRVPLLDGTEKIVDFRSARVEWDAFDLVLPGNIKVEVKSSAYWQSWDQSSPSKVRFDIAEHQYWMAETNKYAGTKCRPADVYVFCVLGSPDERDMDPK